MTFNPDVVVEIAFSSGYATAAASRTWTDVSTYVEAQNAISIQRGRQDEFSDVQPSRATIVLDNRDGRFTPGYTSGAYYPNVLKGRPVRVTATWSAVTYRRFLGYIDEWDVEWPDGSDGKPIVTITASSRSAILGRKTLSNVIANEVLYDSPALYYPLGEPAGSTSVADASVNAAANMTIAQLGTGGTITFANATGPGTDGLSAPTFAPVDGTNGKYLAQTLRAPIVIAGDQHLAFECWLSTTAVVSQTVFDIYVAGSAESIQLTLNGAGVATASGIDTSLGTRFSVSGVGVALNDGLTHHMVLLIDSPGAGSTSVGLYLDGALAGSTSTGTFGANFPTYTDLNVGGSNPIYVGTTFSGAIAHFAAYGTGAQVTSARVTQHYLAGSTGFAGESTDTRIARIARWGGIASGEITAEAGATTSMAAVDYTDKSVSEALLDVVHTENGLLFDAGDGTFTFHARTHRYSTTSSLTLSAATQKVEADFAPKLDDQGVINDATYTGSSGLAYRSIDATSVAAIGTYNDSTEILTTNDYEVQDRANFTTYVYGDPITRVPAASVLLTVQSSGDITSLLGLELGTQITISGLPSQAPASSMDFFIEGIAESIAFENYLMTFTLSPALNELDVFTVEDAVFGQYDAYPLSY